MDFPIKNDESFHSPAETSPKKSIDRSILRPGPLLFFHRRDPELDRALRRRHGSWLTGAVAAIHPPVNQHRPCQIGVGR